MKVSFNLAFLKELSDIPSETRIKIEELVFKNIPGYSTTNEIPAIKKFKRLSALLQNRLGDYRIGVKINNEEISFERVLHRKEIYKRFPQAASVQ